MQLHKKGRSKDTLQETAPHADDGMVAALDNVALEQTTDDHCAQVKGQHADCDGNEKLDWDEKATAEDHSPFYQIAVSCI